MSGDSTASADVPQAGPRPAVGTGLTPEQQEELREFYLMFRGPIERFLRFRLDGPLAVQEVSQDVWLHVVRWWKDKAGRGDEAPVLYTIASRRIADYWRARGRHSRVCSENDVSQATIRLLCGPEEFVPVDARLDFSAAKAALTQRQRMILRLRYDEDLPAAVCAALLGITPSGVTKAIAAAVKVLCASQSLAGYLAPVGSNPQEVRS